MRAMNPAGDPPFTDRALASLIDEAWQRFGVTCMWYIKRSAAAESVVDALRRNGDMPAWRLSVQIEAELKRERAGAA